MTEASAKALVAYPRCTALLFMDQPTGLEASSLLVIHLVVLQNWFDDCFEILDPRTLAASLR
jgi:hypothetical protein